MASMGTREALELGVPEPVAGSATVVLRSGLRLRLPLSFSASALACCRRLFVTPWRCRLRVAGLGGIVRPAWGIRNPGGNPSQYGEAASVLEGSLRLFEVVDPEGSRNEAVGFDTIGMLRETGGSSRAATVSVLAVRFSCRTHTAHDE